MRRNWSPGIALALILAAPLFQNRLAEFKTQFDHERDPVRRAKALTKLGAEQLQNLREQVDEGNLADALRILGDYRDELVATQKALASSGVDAEKRPKGFKELQISLRENLRLLNDILVSMALDDRRPFDDIREQLETVNKEFIKELFPRQPGAAKEPKPKP